MWEKSVCDYFLKALYIWIGCIIPVNIYWECNMYIFHSHDSICSGILFKCFWDSIQHPRCIVWDFSSQLECSASSSFSVASLVPSTLPWITLWNYFDISHKLLFCYGNVDSCAQIFVLHIHGVEWGMSFSNSLSTICWMYFRNFQTVHALISRIRALCLLSLFHISDQLLYCWLDFRFLF